MPTEEEKAAAALAAQEAAAAAAAEEARLAKEVADALKASEDAATAKATADAEAAAAAKKADTNATAEEKLAAALEANRLLAERFAGVDPDKAKADAAAVAAAQKAAAAAEKAKATAEGNFEKLRELQVAENQAIIDAANAARDTALAEAAEAKKALNSARVETAFANAAFIADETVLSGPKAHKVFGDHVEIEDGKVVVYNAPRGAAKRTLIMDSKGNPLPFNDAIKTVIEADPDTDTIVKTKLKPGSGSKTLVDGKIVEGKSRAERMAEGIKKMRGQ